jgi:5-dehydro-2-deoxygluconokinase
VGRSIFRTAADKWFAGQIDDAAATAEIAAAYRQVVDLWRAAAD